MTTHPLVHTADARCPDCGNSDAIVRVKGNAISSVCTRCRRVDVAPMLDDDDLAMVAPELAGDLFELEAARSGSACGLVADPVIVDELPPRLDLSVSLRLPVPPR